MKEIPEDVLLAIQKHFHSVIRERAADLIAKHKLALPELSPLLSESKQEAWFDVPGMYGGFSYRLEGEGDQTALIAESWSRVIEGSGQRHKITAHGSELVEEGFV